MTVSYVEDDEQSKDIKEENEQVNTDIKEKYKSKKQSCLNLGNSNQATLNYIVENKQLINL